MNCIRLFAFLVDEATLVTVNQIKNLAALGLLVYRLCHFHGQTNIILHIKCVL